MIRPATKEDLPAMLAIYGPYVLNTTYSFEYTVPSADAFCARFEGITRQFPWLVWEQDGQILGYAYGSAPFERAAYAWCAEVSIYVAPQAHRKGIGRALYEELERILWLQGYRVIYSLITSENQNSVRFHERVGYRYCFECKDCGFKFGRWLGVIWMEKRSERIDPPLAPPVSWLSVV